MFDLGSTIPLRVVAIAACLVSLLMAGWWLAGPAGAPAVPPLESDPAAALASSARDSTQSTAPLPIATKAQGESPPEGVPHEGAVPPDPSRAPIRDTTTEGVITEQIMLQLFVIQEESARLTSITRQVQAPTTLAAQAQRAVQELFSTGEQEYLSPFPPGAYIREVWVSPVGIAYVDFDSSIRRDLPHGSLAELHVVYSLIGTLTSSFPAIGAVQILVDGQEIETLLGHMDLSRPLFPVTS